MRGLIANSNRVFKMKFNTSNNDFGKMKMKTSNIDIDSNFEPTDKPDEVYYDEIIDYDGGGVDGYGED